MNSKGWLHVRPKNKYIHGNGFVMVPIDVYNGVVGIIGPSNASGICSECGAIGTHATSCASSDIIRDFIDLADNKENISRPKSQRTKDKRFNSASIIRLLIENSGIAFSDASYRYDGYSKHNIERMCYIVECGADRFAVEVPCCSVWKVMQNPNHKITINGENFSFGMAKLSNHPGQAP